MARMIEIERTGSPEVLHAIERTVPPPGAGEVRLRQRAIGLNFVDTYQRAGIYPIALPAVLGVEAMGVVEAVGDGVALAIGQRVAYAGELGAYASERILPAWRAIAIPDALGDAAAATLFARGMTAHMLLDELYAVGTGTTILVHAAAGGLGSLLVAWAKRRGATVIGTVGAAPKAAIARAAGADHVIVGRDADFATQTLALTDDGVDLVYDGVGGATLAASFACTRPFGTVVSIGQTAGPIPPVPVTALSTRSLSLARPSVMRFLADRERYRRAAAAVLASDLATRPGATYAFDDLARAHRELEAGHTTGSGVIVV